MTTISNYNRPILCVFFFSVSLKTNINQMSNRKEQINLHHLRPGRSSLNNQDSIHCKEHNDKLCNSCEDIEDTAPYFTVPDSMLNVMNSPMN